jgi:hypothetical protein
MNKIKKRKKMNIKMKIKAMFLTSFLITNVFAVDYSSYTIEELVNSRGTVAPEDISSFRAAMKLKMQSLPAEERSLYKGNGSQKRLKDGSGGGNQYKGSRGRNR